jgi:orotidine-5'-phosphate decarboxylase
MSREDNDRGAEPALPGRGAGGSDKNDGRERLIVALDQPTLDAALAMVDELGDGVVRYKVGLELFLSAGARALEALHERQKKLFLDLKLHDIPETVARAVRVVVGTGGIDLLTIHTAGGQTMMARAAEVARAAGVRTLGVTVLTSLDADDLARDGIVGTVEEAVVRRARLAQAAGLSGVVASPKEAAAIRAAVGPDFLIVTPGVRASGAAGGDDQKRVATASEARRAGADYVVVGRPIRDAADKRAAAAQLVAELSG